VLPGGRPVGCNFVGFVSPLPSASWARARRIRVDPPGGARGLTFFVQGAAGGDLNWRAAAVLRAFLAVTECGALSSTRRRVAGGRPDWASPHP